MDAHTALEEIARWCARQTAGGDPEAVEVDCHGILCITIGESAPPWRVRRERGSSAGASCPVAQLRYDLERNTWSLHHGGPPGGWCAYDDAVESTELRPLLDVVEEDRAGRFRGLGSGYVWPWDR